ATRADQAALIFISTETDQRRTYSYRELAAEVNCFAAILSAQGVGKGDRVLIYMPMIAEAVFAMLATVRLGAIHSVVFGGFAAARHEGAQMPCAWVESSEPSYILYTSGTTGKPKGVQRDTGGYAVALIASMRDIFCVAPGETMFTTSDIGWVVGHSYIVYAPLLNGSTTIMYEGLPIRPDPGIWWQIVAEHEVRTMFSSPTAIRVLKKQDPAYLKKYDVSSLRYLFLAGEPLDEPTARWAADSLGVPIVDHYWQTESGWPILSAQPGIEDTPRKFGSPSFPVCGYDVRLVDESTGKEVGTDEKGVLVIMPPLPPGCMTTVCDDDE